MSRALESRLRENLTNPEKWTVAGVEGVKDEVSFSRGRDVRQPQTCGLGHEGPRIRCQGMPGRQPVKDHDQEERQRIDSSRVYGDPESDVRQR